MSGLIEEIQRDALNPLIRVEYILRKVKVAASKLKIGALEDWVHNELNGYKGNLPEYRKVTGSPRAFNPYNGWIPISGNSKFLEIISHADIRQSIGSITDLLTQKSDGTYSLPMPPSGVEFVNKYIDMEVPRISIEIARGTLVAIVDHVRELSLDWSLEIESKGIRGENMSFDQNEREIAAKSVFFINNSGTMSGNIGQENKSNDIITNVSNSNSIFSEIKDEFLKLELTDEINFIIEKIYNMEKNSKDKVNFVASYGEFIQSAANHIAIISPFLPRLFELFGI